MFKRTLAALAVTVLGALALAAPAQAAPLVRQAPFTVAFSDDACDGTTVVTLTNNLGGEHAIGLVFSINGDETTVDPGTTKTVDEVYPNSLHVVVDLVGAFTTPTEDTLSKVEVVTHWVHDWKRPAGCWKVAVVSHCDGSQALSVVNTAPAAATFVVSVDTTAPVTVPIAGNATFTAVYAGKPTVTVVTDDETTATFVWAAKGCATPQPTPTPSPIGVVLVGNPGPELPVTGQDLSTNVTLIWVSGLGLVLLGLGAWILRRRARTSV